LLPAFKFAESPFLGATDWDFDHGLDNISIIQCKFWKKFKKWCAEVVQFLGLVKEGYKNIKDIKRTHDELNAHPKHFHPNARIN
jgi:hypothetical protein